MSIAKMSLIDIKGNKKYLDEVLLRCTNSNVFHPEYASSLSEYSTGASALKEDNPYTDILRKISDISLSNGIELHYNGYDDIEIDTDKIEEFVDSLKEKLSTLTHKKKGLEQIILSHKQALIQLEHLKNLNVNFDELFACKYVKVRFGKLPTDSYQKLRFFDDKPFVFISIDNDPQYHWCIYLTSDNNRDEIDAIFSSLFFERTRIPDYAHGTPQKAQDFIINDLRREEKLLAEVCTAIAKIKRAESERFIKTYSLVKFLCDSFEMRKYAVVIKGIFHVVGFIPKVEKENFLKLFDGMGTVVKILNKSNNAPTYKVRANGKEEASGEINGEDDQKKFIDLFEGMGVIDIVTNSPDHDDRLVAPVKLKNNRFVQPYEMFVNMYGMPSYKDFDPTTLVALTYTFLFGLMFGDLGQGLVICLVGYFMFKKKGMQLGRILLRCGVSSSIFGTIYGSVFGYEELLNPMYKAVFGLEGKPIHVMAGDTTTMILIAAIAIGVFIIMTSISINIILGFRQKDYSRAIFSHNGLAGLVFYAAVIVAAVCTLMFGINLLNPIYVICLIVVPLLLIFFKEPISRIMEKKKDIFHEGVVAFITESFFEMFEVLLSFTTNTMSFLRVGGFILSHAGMMLVVMTLSEMVGAAASPIVVIIGNIFVMGIEGLIVGIQVLRLEFYEIFSRFFDGDGKPFEPVQIKYDQINS